MTIAEKVKDRLPDIQTVLTLYGIEFNRHGAALCPFHAEKTASLKCHDGYFHCFGCGAGGDAIKFVQLYFGLSFLDAVKRLNTDFRLGLGMEPGKKTSYSEVMRRQKQQEREQNERERFEREYIRMAEEHRRLYHAYLHDAPEHPGDPIRDSYAEACIRLPHFEWWLDTHPFTGEVRCT
jgi:DNA primase